MDNVKNIIFVLMYHRHKLLDFIYITGRKDMSLVWEKIFTNFKARSQEFIYLEPEGRKS
jgi:hypothetical protein